MESTQFEMLDAKQKFNTSTGRITDANNLHEIDSTLQQLSDIISEFEKRGQFYSDRKTYRYASTQYKVDEETKSEQADSVSATRLLIARNSLRILQVTIPALTKLCEQGLAIAGKDLVRMACKSQEREGTDWNGNKFAPIPSEFVLPKEYETVAGSIVSTLKAAIGK